MSTTDNIHKKVLSTNALKTNFISNTTQKLKDHQKRFSNISKEKQPLHEFRQTIHKNTARYYEQVDMQGSATILPQKNSSRKNIYMNQNSNLPIQVPSNQRKQQLNLNTLKAKSPIDKSRLNTISNFTTPLTMINNNLNLHSTNKVSGITSDTGMINANNLGMINANNASMINANAAMNNNNIAAKIQHNAAYLPKSIPQIKNLTNKMSQILTEREKSYREHKEEPSRQQREQNTKDQQIIKMKSMIMNQRKLSIQMDDLRCDQQMEITLVPQNQHPRKLSNHFSNKNQAKIIQKDDYMKDNLSEQINRTQKKQPLDKPTMNLQKTKSEHPKQHILNTLGSYNAGQKLISQMIGNNQNQQTITLQQGACRQQPKYYQSVASMEEQLKKFSQMQQNLNMGAEVQTIIRLQSRQRDYTVQPNYIDLRQKNFNWFMRAVLMDWMMHVCFQFGLKRQTYYIAVALVDKYLQKTTDLPKSDFQLIGAASMFIASKLEQFEALSSSDFSKSTDNRYSSIEIRQTELKICRCMNYQLNPPTLYMWANRFMVHWDNYIDVTNAKFHPYFQTHKHKFFKKQSQDSYLLFRQMVQFIDCSNLDVQTLQFAPKILVCSFMYLVLGKNYKEWPAKRITEEFPRTSHYLVEEEELSSFNHMFHMFLSESFELDIIELLPAVQYCSTYFTLILNFDAPSYALKNSQQEESKLSLQQYESFQTYNGKMIDLIKKRYRGVYP